MEISVSFISNSEPQLMQTTKHQYHCSLNVGWRNYFENEVVSIELYQLLPPYPVLNLLRLLSHLPQIEPFDIYLDHTFISYIELNHG